MSNELMIRIAETRPKTLDELQCTSWHGRHASGSLWVDHSGYREDESRAARRRDAMLADQRQDLDKRRADGKVGGDGKAREVSARLERKIYLRLQELRQKQAVSQRVKAFEVAGDALLASDRETGAGRAWMSLKRYAASPKAGSRRTPTRSSPLSPRCDLSYLADRRL